MEPSTYFPGETAESVNAKQEPSRGDGLPATISGIVRRNQDLLRNAGSLLGTTGLTSGLGFAYWIFAAHFFSQQSVGYGSAAVSSVSLLGTIGMFGLGTVLIGELPQRSSKAGLVMAALCASAIGSLILGLAFAFMSFAFGHRFIEINGSPGRIAVFTLGVALTGAALVFDEATIGLLRGGIQLTRNAAFSVAKMAALPVTAIVVHSEFGVGILFSWILGTVVSLVPVAVMFRRGGSSILHRPDWDSLRKLARLTIAHNWLNLAITVPPQLMPVIVTVLVSPSANAAFYVGSMIAGIVYMVPTHLSTVLFAIASATPSAIGEKLRFVLKLSYAIGLPIVLVLGAGAHLILSVFGPEYARLGTVPMWLLLLAYIPAVPKTQYIAVCRATGQVSRASGILLVQSVAEMAGLVAGGKADGLDGVCAALLVVSVLEGLMTAPLVIRAATGRLRLPAADRTESVPAGTAADGPVFIPAYSADYQHQQNAGLAALFAIATATKPAEDAYRTITGSLPAIREPVADPAARAPQFRPRPTFSPVQDPRQHPVRVPGAPDATRLDLRAVGPDVDATRLDLQAVGSDVDATRLDLQAVGPDVDATRLDLRAVADGNEADHRNRQSGGLDILTALSRRPPRF